jgi:hypothetical protein
MKVCPNPETLALYAGEELDSSERAGVATHIIQCSTCGALVAELQSDRELLQSHPDITEGAIQDVHQRVMSELPVAGSLRRYLWPAAIAACVALLALSSMWSSRLLRRQPEAQPTAHRGYRPAPPIVSEKAPELQQTTKVQSQAPRKIRRRPAKSSDAELIAALDQLFETEPPAAEPTDGEVVITMLTEDPNVTIILLADSTGETE